MKLASFVHGNGTRIGVVEGDEIADIAGADATLPADMAAFLALGAAGMARARAAAAKAPRLKRRDVKLAAAVPNPPNVFAIGMNYADHIAEARKFPQFKDLPTPTFPIWFMKGKSAINGPYDPIWRPRVSDTLDYEGELGVVIGRRCRHVPKDKARSVIAGLTVVNDGSVREWQQHAQTFTAGKGFETTGPIGPWIVTLDEAGDYNHLAIRTWVNDELRQNGNTKDMIFSVDEQIAYLSTMCTLLPGDVISTGTPLGVGGFGDTPRWLKPGDRVKIEIETIGFIENEIVDEPADTAVW